MTPEDVSAWLARYLEAWRTYDRDAITLLFNSETEYRYHPWDPPIHGSEAIADSWLREKDEPGTWSAEYHPTSIQGNTAVVEGRTSYSDGTTYSNLFQLVFDDDGSCSAFTEWYMQHGSD